MNGSEQVARWVKLAEERQRILAQVAPKIPDGRGRPESGTRAASRDLAPTDCAWAARVLKGHIDSIVPLRARPGASAWLRRELRELELRAMRPVEFYISEKGEAFADGKLIPFAGRGLVIAHQAIFALQQNATLDVAELAPESARPDNQVREALRRAGAAADRVDHRLGAAIAALAMRKGKIIATSSAIDRVICVAFNSTTSCARDTGSTFITEP